MILHPHDQVIRCAAWMKTHRVGPKYLSINWRCKSRILTHTSQHITIGYPIWTFMITLLRCDGWTSQSNLRWHTIGLLSHGLRNNYHVFLIITTSNFIVDVITLRWSISGNVHHFHLPNEMTPLSASINAQDWETTILHWPMDQHTFAHTPGTWLFIHHTCIKVSAYAFA